MVPYVERWVSVIEKSIHARRSEWYSHNDNEKTKPKLRQWSGNFILRVEFRANNMQYFGNECVLHAEGIVAPAEEPQMATTLPVSSSSIHNCVFYSKITIRIDEYLSKDWISFAAEMQAHDVRVKRYVRMLSGALDMHPKRMPEEHAAIAKDSTYRISKRMWHFSNTFSESIKRLLEANRANNDNNELSPT